MFSAVRFRRMNTGGAYYNEHDGFAVKWMHKLANARLISQGKIDARDIQRIGASELAGHRRCHFFAGIGGWDLALRLAGWPTDREVWTGSCPCQPFSSAGKQKGENDPRHLWPDFFRLIKECRPDTIFGEQVAAAIKHGWLDGVFGDLEGIDYACGAVVVGAHSVGAPHIRQRLYWVASRGDDGRSAGHGEAEAERGEVGLRSRAVPGDSGAVDYGRLEHHDLQRQGPTDNRKRAGAIRGPSEDGGVGDDSGSRRNAWGAFAGECCEEGEPVPSTGQPKGPWSDYRIIPCTDGKARRIGSRVFPLAHGIPRGVGSVGSWRKGLARGASRARVGMLKGSGNAIVPELAAEFVRAYMDTLCRK